MRLVYFKKIVSATKKQLQKLVIFKLSANKWQLLSSAFSHMGQAIILFSLAALFVPEAASLTKDFSRIYAFLYLLGGLLFLVSAIIIRDRGK